VAIMLEKLGFQALIEATVKVTRLTKVMNGYQSRMAPRANPKTEPAKRGVNYYLWLGGVNK